ncbi:MAG: hypothetical protein M1826_005266 [Phylliscum demangeonii]|nr:MAG: hypothetical protein M1826_005266 [Phylliscum demangeonii]
MSSSRPAAKKRQKVSQPTISFGAKSKITKASSALGGAHAKKGGSKKDAIKTQISVSASPSVSERESPPPPPTHTTAEIAIRQQAKEEVKKTVRSKQEERAAKVDDAQLKRYWRAKELERKAPRVHQGELSMNEKILRHFDLSSQYGVRNCP